MKILVTGGTGFIGSRLALRSLEKGNNVRILGQVNNTGEEKNRTFLESRGAEFIIGSVTDEERVQRAVDTVTIVYHLAAAQHEVNVPDQHFWNVNVKGTQNLLEASLRAGVKRFVHGSTIGVYGSALAGEIDEHTALRPDNIYGITKGEGEQLVLSYAERIPLAVVRISETYGPGDHRLLKLFKAIDKRLFIMIGDGENKHQLIYVDDLVDGLELIASSEKALGEVFVLAGKEVLTTNQMVTCIAEVLGVRQRRLRVPLWPLLGTALILEKTLRPLGIQPPLHRRRMDFFTKSFYFSCVKAINSLQFEPKTSFLEGASETAKWYRSHGYL
jgi:nucleoside-diphosphate-sugar epimerase